MATQKEVKSRIASIKNINKITRAMEMVAAARLRRAEQRIEALRPYAEGMRRLTRRAAENAGGVPRVPVLEEHESEKRVGLLLVTGDRGLAGAFNTNIIRDGMRLAGELRERGVEPDFSAVGRKGVSALTFRKQELSGTYIGFTDRPAFANAREIGEELTARYVDGEVDRVELVYNRYVSPLTQHVWRQTLLPMQQAEVIGEGVDEEEAEGEPTEAEQAQASALWEYEPEAEILLGQADSRVREHLGLPGSARVRRLRAGGADDRDAERGGERRNDHGRPHPGNEPGQAVRDHAGDPRGCRRRRGAWISERFRTIKDKRKRCLRATERNVGRVEQVTGVVVDAYFPEQLPEIYSALEIEMGGEGDVEKTNLVCEVQQHLGDDRVRAVAMDATDGLKRGDRVVDTGNPITVPVGDETLGRIFNLLGEPIDDGAELKDERALADPPAGAVRVGPRPDPGDPRDRDQGHRPARPLRQRRQGRAVRRRRRRQDGPDPGADPQHRRGARRPLRVRRRRRALPRGQRPLARDERVGRAREDDARLRPDERAARARACASPSPA